MEEIPFSRKHYWRFVDSEALELQALSWGIGGFAPKVSFALKSLALPILNFSEHSCIFPVDAS